MSVVDRLRDVVTLVPPRGPARRLVLVALVDAVGTGFLLAGAAVFYLRVLGLDAREIGLGLALSSVVGFLTTVPLGMVGDRVGPRRMLVALHLWRAAWTVALPWSDSLPRFVLVTSMLAIAECALVPLTRALVSDAVAEDERTRTLGFMRAWRNIGFAAGGALTAPLIAIDTRWAYLTVMFAVAASCVAAAAVISRLRLPVLDGGAGQGAPPSSPRSATGSPAGRRRTVPAVLRDRPFVALVLVDTVLMMHTTLLSLGFPLWISQHTEAPTVLVPAVVVLNTVLAVALQVRFASIDTTAQGRRALRRAGLALAATCVLMSLSGRGDTWTAVVLVLCAVVTLTAGELWEAAGSWSLSYAFAPEERESEYLSVFSLGSTAQYAVAPIVITGFVLEAGGPGWLLLAVVFAGVAALVGPVVSGLERDRARALRPGRSSSPAPGVPVALPVAET